MDLSVPAGIAISAGSFVVGWLIYDTLCKTIKHDLALSIIVYILLIAAAWGYSQVFGGRAAYIHVGVLIGTIMVWNVFFHIIPGQKKMVSEIRAGKAPDPRPGIIGKQRSVHNTYFTLPVLFIMISNHYPMTYGNKYGWAILAVLMLAGALIRCTSSSGMSARIWSRCRRRRRSSCSASRSRSRRRRAAGAAPAATQEFLCQVQPIIDERCTVCHAAKPTFTGFAQAPGGLMFDTPEQIQAAALRIHQQTIATQAMPIGNLTKMTDEERQLLGRWLTEGANTK